MFQICVDDGVMLLAGKIVGMEETDKFHRTFVLFLAATQNLRKARVKPASNPLQGLRWQLKKYRSRVSGNSNQEKQNGEES